MIRTLTHGNICSSPMVWKLLFFFVFCAQVVRLTPDWGEEAAWGIFPPSQSWCDDTLFFFCKGLKVPNGTLLALCSFGTPLKSKPLFTFSLTFISLGIVGGICLLFLVQESDIGHFPLDFRVFFYIYMQVGLACNTIYCHYCQISAYKIVLHFDLV